MVIITFSDKQDKLYKRKEKKTKRTRGTRSAPKKEKQKNRQTTFQAALINSKTSPYKEETPIPKTMLNNICYCTILLTSALSSYILAFLSNHIPQRTAKPAQKIACYCHRIKS